MTCKEIEELLSAYLDKVLDAETEQKVLEHLTGCSRCRAELDSLQTTIEMLNQLPEIEPPSNFREELRKKLAAEATTKKVVEINSGKKKAKKWLPVVAVAAMFFLVVAIGQLAGQLGVTDLMDFRMGSGSSSPSVASSSGRDKAEDSVAMFDAAPEPSSAKIMDEGYGGTYENRVIMPEGAISQNLTVKPTSGVQGDGIAVEESRQGEIEEEIGIMAEDADSYQRKIIKNAYLNMEVTQYQQAVRQIEEIAVGFNGYIQDSSHLVSQQGAYSGQLIIRVPQGQFELAITQLKELGRMKSERLAGEDITMEYYDVDGRLKVAREKEARLLELLQQADRLEDVLNIERELGYTRNEIEHLAGRLRYYNQVTDLATINITLTEQVIKTEMIVAPGLAGIFQRAGEAFIITTNKMLTFLGEVVVFGGASLPVLLVLGVLAILIVVVVKTRRNQSKQ